MRTIVGTLLASKGEYTITDVEGHTRSGTVQFRSDCFDGPLPLLLDHFPVDLGTVWFVERQRGGAIVAVAEVADNVRVDLTGKYLSAGFSSLSRSRVSSSATISVVDQRNARLEEVSIVDCTAANVTSPIAVIGHDVRQVRGGYPFGMNPMYRAVLDRAVLYAHTHRHERHVTIVDAPAPHPPAPAPALRAPARRSNQRSVDASVTTGTDGKVRHTRINIGEILTVR